MSGMEKPYKVWQKYHRVNLETGKDTVESFAGVMLQADYCLQFLRDVNRTPFLYVYYVDPDDALELTSAEWEAYQRIDRARQGSTS